MTRRQSLHFLVLAVLGFSLGCAPLIEKPLSPGSFDDLPFCFAIFPAEPWESVHKIETASQGKAFPTLLGVTQGDPTARGLHSFLLTPEGFILFESELRQGKVRTLKAVPPFDWPAFAKGLMEDVALLFLSPEGKPASWGRRDDGSQTCLWKGPGGGRTEIQGSMDRGWRILHRDDQGDATREVLLKGPFVHGLAAQMELQAFKPAPYRLRMTLIQATP